MALAGNPLELELTNGILIDPNASKEINTPNDSVVVYKDPLFKTVAADTATLVKKLASDGQRELWLVTLDASGVTLQQWIKSEIYVAPV